MFDKIISELHKILCKLNIHSCEIEQDKTEIKYIFYRISRPVYLIYLKCKYCEYKTIKVLRE
jgi:hypothetical protein